MDRTSVVSSSIASVGYDPDGMTLEVEFNRGTVYQYFDVPVTEYEQMMYAASIGRYINMEINDRYRCIQP